MGEVCLRVPPDWGIGPGLRGEETWVSVVVQSPRDGGRVQDLKWGREVAMEVTGDPVR